MAYQDYIKSSVINPIKNAKILSGKGYKFANGNEPLDPSDDPNILGYKLIVINNNWVMWWTYYVDGTRTKHKGSTLDTTYPGF